MNPATKTIRVVTLNMHKGFSFLNWNPTLVTLKENIKALEADVACLQEVVGHHQEFSPSPQFEYLADEIWSHYAYGKNAIYSEGHHGNAILSHFPFQFQENIDVSNHKYERRGILHGTVVVPEWQSMRLHILTLHFDLTSWGRRRQLNALCKLIETRIPDAEPLVVCGDFNDWLGHATDILKERAGLDEAFVRLTGEHARTFPAGLPILPLDRIYVRGLTVVSATRLDHPRWRSLSDHLGLCAELTKIL